MGKALNPKFENASVAAIASFLEISPQRVRQIISNDLKAKPVDRIGNVPLYSYRTFLLIRNRNKKPGPANGSGRPKKKR